jgi:Na+/H+ antiporter NhaD/arsenite permease-like protein
MLLVRPWIRMNKYRITSFHIVFFIFIVSNIGGCLTPIGDPPLFMGYLKGIPFWWTAEHLWQGWLIALVLLLGIFFILDRANFLRAPKAVRDAETAKETWEFRGLHNVFFIALVLFAVLKLPMWWRELLMLAAALGSMFTTRKEIHAANDFNFAPLKEVVWLFIGIFATMVPALQYLQASPPPLAGPGSYYWATGVLSGMLDNAPTYLAFFATAMGANHLSLDSHADIALFVANHGETLRAISFGAVLFGAMTYIGNGPNFMVKAIAEHSKVHTPTFIGYVVRYALPFLLPVLFVVWLALFYF